VVHAGFGKIKYKSGTWLACCALHPPADRRLLLSLAFVGFCLSMMILCLPRLAQAHYVDLCLWARVLAFVIGCLSYQINVVLKRLELDSYWALNEGGNDAHLWNELELELIQSQMAQSQMAQIGLVREPQTPHTLAICIQLKRS
jgi:hypothetical protein